MNLSKIITKYYSKLKSMLKKDLKGRARLSKAQIISILVLPIFVTWLTNKKWKFLTGWVTQNLRKAYRWWKNIKMLSKKLGKSRKKLKGLKIVTKLISNHYGMYWAWHKLQFLIILKKINKIELKITQLQNK